MAEVGQLEALLSRQENHYELEDCRLALFQGG